MIDHHACTPAIFVTAIAKINNVEDESEGIQCQQQIDGYVFKNLAKLHNTDRDFFHIAIVKLLKILVFFPLGLFWQRVV
jgi:hypothetical protein